MSKSYMGLILANQNTDNIRGLTKYRPIATIPFAGRYRILDFALTNISRAGITNLGIISDQNDVRSIKDHVRGGQYWDLNRKDGGIFLMNSALSTELKKDSLANLRANLEYLSRSRQKNVVIYPANLIGNIDMDEVIKSHETSGKDLTLLYKEIGEKIESDRGNTSIVLSEEGGPTKFGTVVNLDEGTKISLGIKIIKKDILMNLIMNGIQKGTLNSLVKLIEKNVNKVATNYHKIDTYTRFVNTTVDYQQASKDVLKSDIRRELLMANGGISTKINDTPPAHYEETAIVDNALIANGCRVKGTIRNSIIGRRVKVEEGAVIENSIILQSCTIEEGAEVRHVIMDKNTIIGRYQVLNGTEEFPMVIEKKSFFNR